MLVKIIIIASGWKKIFHTFIQYQFHFSCFHTFTSLLQGGRGPRTSEPNWGSPCLQIPVSGDVLPLGREGDNNDGENDAAAAADDDDGDYDGDGEDDTDDYCMHYLHHLHKNHHTHP